MARDPNPKNRHSIRVPAYDYAQPGAYFITLVTHERECLFGEIISGRMELSPLGRIAEEQWFRLPRRFPHWAADAFQVMPNHTHGVLNKHGAIESVGAQRSFNLSGSESATLRPALNINRDLSSSLVTPGKNDASDCIRRGAARPDRLGALEGSLRPYPAQNPNLHQVETDSLAAVVRAYKSAVAFRCHQILIGIEKPLWQRNYYEHIIRDEDDLNRIRLYIRENPLRWSLDEDNILPAS